MSKPFAKGGALQLSCSRYGVSLVWNKGHAELDLQALVVDDKGNIVDVVCRSHPENSDRSLTHTGGFALDPDEITRQAEAREETVWVSLTKVKPRTKLIIFVAAAMGSGTLDP